MMEPTPPTGLVDSVMERIHALRSTRRAGLTPQQEKKVKGLRKKRARRGNPFYNLDFVTDEMSPDVARQAELTARRARQTERGNRELLRKKGAGLLGAPRVWRWNTTDVDKVAAAKAKNDRRNEGRLVQRARQAGGRWDARQEVGHGDAGRHIAAQRRRRRR